MEPDYDSREQEVLMHVFMAMLWEPTKDGGRKRVAGIKVPWWRDPGHVEHMQNHLAAYEYGNKVDKDSGAHPLVHVAWRALAQAYQEVVGQVDPDD